VAEALVTNFFRFGVLQELHSDQGRNFQTRLIQEVLQCVGVSKMHTMPLYLQSVGQVEEHIQKVVASHQSDWDAR
jgi:hypothetical protein